MRLGILARGDPADVRTWSGIPNFMTRELARHFEAIEWVPVGQGMAQRKLMDAKDRVDRWSRRLLGRGFIPGAGLLQSRLIAAEIERLLARRAIDLLFAITVDDFLAFLETDLPIVHHSDTTFAGIEGYYPQYTGLWKWSSKAGHKIARGALARSALDIYPSRWAAGSAVRDYHADPAKVHVVPYGANLLAAPPRDEATDISRRTTCQLLFMGVDWERKGGGVAFATLIELHNRGIDATLVVVGCEPPRGIAHPRLRVVPFLNKQVPDQLDTYLSLWRSSAFFFMPSRQETFGAVFCEAAAHGLPAIATETGGVADAVEHGVSGFLLPPGAQAAAYADLVERAWRDRQGYAKLVRTSRDRYDRVLNWHAWGDTVAGLIHDLIDKRGRSR